MKYAIVALLLLMPFAVMAAPAAPEGYYLWKLPNGETGGYFDFGPAAPPGGGTQFMALWLLNENNKKYLAAMYECSWTGDWLIAYDSNGRKWWCFWWSAANNRWQVYSYDTSLGLPRWLYHGHLEKY